MWVVTIVSVGSTIRVELENLVAESVVKSADSVD